jgi:hypothetical protein
LLVSLSLFFPLCGGLKAGWIEVNDWGFDDDDDIDNVMSIRQRDLSMDLLRFSIDVFNDGGRQDKST